MVINNSVQKFIVCNCVLCVQIEYDVEIYGFEKKIELLFVMVVLVDLVGKLCEELLLVMDCKFFDIDIDNFNECMKVIVLCVVFVVLNMLMGEGQLMVDIMLENMDDFLLVQIVCKVDVLNQLLEVCI